jgi:hypothetical protein
MAKHHPLIELTPEQEAAAQRMEQALLEAARSDIRQLARLMVSKEDHEIFGQTEYEVRDLVHGIGAKALEMTANERSKKGVLRQ